MGLTQAAYARHRGVSPAAVTYALQAGRIRKLPDGTIDPADADAMWEANTKTPQNTAQTAAALPKAPPSDAPVYNDERALHERVKRELAEVKLAEERGRLLDRDDVRSGIVSAFRAIRDRVRALPSRLAQQLAGESDAGRILVLLRTEIDQALTDALSVADDVAPVADEEE